MKFGRFQRALHQSIDFSGGTIRVTLDGMRGDQFFGTVLFNGKPAGKFSADPAKLQALASLGKDVTLSQVKDVLGAVYAGPERRTQQTPWDGVERRQTRLEA
jgi:hypothetical protein